MTVTIQDLEVHSPVLSYKCTKGKPIHGRTSLFPFGFPCFHFSCEQYSVKICFFVECFPQVFVMVIVFCFQTVERAETAEYRVGELEREADLMAGMNYINECPTSTFLPTTKALHSGKGRNKWKSSFQCSHFSIFTQCFFSFEQFPQIVFVTSPPFDTTVLKFVPRKKDKPWNEALLKTIASNVN